MVKRARLTATCLIVAALLCSACDRKGHQQRQFYAFGTIVTLHTYGTSTREADKAVAALEPYYQTIDNDWYPWARQGSAAAGELVAVNEAIAGGRVQKVSPRLAALIKRATEIEQLSAGLFSPASGRLTLLWGLDDLAEAPASLPDPDAISALLNANLSTSALNWDGNNLQSSSQDILLDLGGIAKGAILALSVDILSAQGIQSAIVDIGGDLTVIGQVNGSAARIGIRSPTGSGAIGWLYVGDGETVVTSGDYERYIEIEGHRYPHILDPRTGYPVLHTSSVTVVHTDPLLADASATALVVGGADEFDEICRKLGVSVALLIDASGDMRLTPAMQKRVKWTTTSTSF